MTWNERTHKQFLLAIGTLVVIIAVVSLRWSGQRALGNIQLDNWHWTSSFFKESQFRQLQVTIRNITQIDHGIADITIWGKNESGVVVFEEVIHTSLPPNSQLSHSLIVHGPKLDQVATISIGRIEISR